MLTDHEERRTAEEALEKLNAHEDVTRNMFAAAALQGAFANAYAEIDDVKAVAAFCFAVADAMMSERYR